MSLFLLWFRLCQMAIQRLIGFKKEEFVVFAILEEPDRIRF